MTDDALLAHWLARWAAWMRWTAGEYPCGAPSIASGFQSAQSNYAVSADDPSDYWDGHVVPGILSAIDAAVDSLSEHERKAVWWKHGLTRQEPPNACSTYAIAYVHVRRLIAQRTSIAA